MNVFVDEQQNTQYTEVAVTKALESIEAASANIPIIVDFDETLFLRNSTAEYLNSLQPRLLGALVLKIINYLELWNWLPSPIRGKTSRDWLRVMIATILFPWTIFLWQSKAKKLAHSYSNIKLLSALNKNSQASITVATLGFDFIVRPILRHLPLECDRLIACRFWQGASDRAKGKLQMVSQVLGTEAVSRAVAITDSDNDRDLLSQVAHPCLVVWSEAQNVQPMENIYLPFFYLERVKRPGKNYLLKTILADDLFVLIFAFSWLSPQPILTTVSLFFFLVSFWCIYELGYQENDLVAEKYEGEPVLSESYQKYKQINYSFAPWLWSSFLGLVGLIFWQIRDNSDLTLVFSEQNFSTSLIIFISWLGFLLLVRLGFKIYNYTNKKGRIWLYPLLQAYRYFGFLLIAPTNIVGTVLLTSQALARSIPYIIYRYSGGNKDSWPELSKKFFRCFVFSFLLIAYSIGNNDLSLLKSGQGLAILVWCILRSWSEIGKVLSQVKPIWQDGAS